MVSQEIQFFISINNGIVEQVGRSYIRHPEIKFSGKQTKWLEDKIGKEKRCGRI